MSTTAAYGIPTGPGTLHNPGTDLTGIAPEGAGQVIPAATNSLFADINNAIQDFGTYQAQKLQSQAQQELAKGQDATASGYDAAAKGDLQEANMYTAAGNIAGENAGLAISAGQVEQYQEYLTAKKTVGSQTAEISASGFRESGTALNLLRASQQQTNLNQQLTGLQSQLQAGGFYEQEAASGAESAAASSASSVATAASAAAHAAGASELAVSSADLALANAAANAGTFSQTMAANQAAVISQLSGTQAQQDAINKVSGAIKGLSPNNTNVNIGPIPVVNPVTGMPIAGTTGASDMTATVKPKGTPVPFGQLF